MNKNMREIKKCEATGAHVVNIKNGKLTYATGGISQDPNHCDSCPYLKFLPDPDPFDWFRDDDEKAVCQKMRAMVAGCLEHSSEMVNLEKPIWCPDLKRELTEEEKADLPNRLKYAKSRYST